MTPPKPPPQELIEHTVRLALAEDVGPGDLTAALIPSSTRAQARVVTREAMVLAGSPWFQAVFRQLSDDITITWEASEGTLLRPGGTICRLSGPARALLSGERAALNFLQLLSGTATTTRVYVEAVRGTRARLLDTRKTVPGLRMAQKYAVRCGGGHNHRMGLFDAVLIKENHIRAAGSLTAAVSRARTRYPETTVEVEVEDLEQLREALQAGATRILLDNFPPDDLREAVSVTQGRAELEASGGVTLENIRAIAESGVDWISVGALTKDVHAVDLSMRFD